jgi:uncharacterized protein (DUF488 family)
MTICTIGHSTDPIEVFVGTLHHHGITAVADVRRYPGSRRHPQFGRDALRQSLADAGIAYEHFLELGGRRTPRRDSLNTAWRVAAFRGYADYMETPQFESGIARLLEFAGRHRAAIMCAERVWWSCHRGLIADLLKSRGHDVQHITSSDRAEPHPYTAAARIIGGRLTYAGLV